MNRQTPRSGFMLFSQTGLSLIILTACLAMLKPFFPDAWVELFAGWIHSDFDTLAQFAVQGLGVLGCMGLASCMFSVLIYD